MYSSEENAKSPGKGRLNLLQANTEQNRGNCLRITGTTSKLRPWNGGNCVYRDCSFESLTGLLKSLASKSSPQAGQGQYEYKSESATDRFEVES